MISSFKTKDLYTNYRINSVANLKYRDQIFKQKKPLLKQRLKPKQTV